MPQDHSAQPPPQDSRPASPKAVAWSWSAAARGAVYALPGGVAALHDPAQGIALAVGVLPAAAMPLPARRRLRLVAVVAGLCVGLPMVLGAVLVQNTWTAVAGVFALAVGTALLAARRPAGGLLMSLCLPMVGAGFSYPDVGQALGLAALMLAGSAYAWVVSLAWPVSAPQNRPAPALPERSAALGYGVRLGLAGAVTAAFGLALAPTHPGWPVAAALLVMRPAPQMQRLRSVGRVLSVLAGGLAALALLHLAPPGWGYGVGAVCTVALAAATRGSRWYIMPAFVTFLVLVMMLLPAPAREQAGFDERLAATLFGVAVAYLFGLAVPRLLGRS
ncbi:FUSC family protein [Streptomyces sp. NPDC051815]|uniref:FUSC family protein n=1 Tax=Streptomyces sp. NPDC051815 TaxID=3365674 RepID=UPI0037965706